MVLTPSQLSQFERDGFLVIERFFDVYDTSRLKQRAEQLLEGFSMEGHPMTRFTTANDKTHVGDDYFLTSGDKIRFFFEQDAFDGEGRLKIAKEKAVNKIGHALHELDPVFREFSLRDTIVDIASDLNFKSPKVLQSMLIFKQPFIGSSVPPHQDSTFLYTEPKSAVGFWFALEDCTKRNGCLSFIPGSHKDTPVTRRFVRDPAGGTMFVGDQPTIDESKFVVKEVKAGTLVLIHGSVVHQSPINRSSDSRFIYTFHVIEGEADYPSDNWLQPTDNMPFTSLKKK
ncbi:hypothetical protein DFQ28_009093 [Apophysomyces sp. BC1034]|nr:hypothetical protein DFQ30_009012 [Apophysomyces sp. BC1015]KAG0173317.1 hypothetical protein DFQ29_007996 [Apophysomyces sp. BC1021]KAG0185608.1 hypothetical protein DFQ28_009093 [Apophysomyces sp. BC1034]